MFIISYHISTCQDRIISLFSSLFPLPSSLFPLFFLHSPRPPHISISHLPTSPSTEIAVKNINKHVSSSNPTNLPNSLPQSPTPPRKTPHIQTSTRRHHQKESTKNRRNAMAQIPPLHILHSLCCRHSLFHWIQHCHVTAST